MAPMGEAEILMAGAHSLATAAAPYHHDVLRDDTLRRMLPGHS